MILINIYLRFALMAVLTIGGIILSFAINFWYGFPFWLAGLVLIVGYILLGTVQSAAGFIQKMQFIEAEKRLALTYKPAWLFKTNRSYFYIIKGTVALNLKKTDEAEFWLKKADGMDLQTDEERAMVALQLANIYGTKGKWKMAQNHFREAKKQKVRDPNIKEQIKQFEGALKNRGQMKHMRQGRNPMTGVSGKRNRPKMR